MARPALVRHGLLIIAELRDRTRLRPGAARGLVQPFTPHHEGVMEAVIRDPDGRHVNLQVPVPWGVAVRDADALHEESYGAR